MLDSNETDRLGASVPLRALTEKIKEIFGEATV